jgi:hypothetical protein
MSIPEERMARGMDPIKAMRYGLDECLIALGASYSDLADEDSWRYPVPGRHNGPHRPVTEAALCIVSRQSPKRCHCRPAECTGSAATPLEAERARRNGAAPVGCGLPGA